MTTEEMILMILTILALAGLLVYLHFIKPVLVTRRDRQRHSNGGGPSMSLERSSSAERGGLSSLRTLTANLSGGRIEITDGNADILLNALDQVWQKHKKPEGAE